ncbi:hypothetical protein JW979_13295, partial [bacterium]|nr:hypothetical protein [candidate division CSSED10-310 bacterium]
ASPFHSGISEFVNTDATYSGYGLTLSAERHFRSDLPAHPFASAGIGVERYEIKGHGRTGHWVPDIHVEPSGDGFVPKVFAGCGYRFTAGAARIDILVQYHQFFFSDNAGYYVTGGTAVMFAHPWSSSR